MAKIIYISGFYKTIETVEDNLKSFDNESNLYLYNELYYNKQIIPTLEEMRKYIEKINENIKDLVVRFESADSDVVTEIDSMELILNINDVDNATGVKNAFESTEAEIEKDGIINAQFRKIPILNDLEWYTNQDEFDEDSYERFCSCLHEAGVTMDDSYEEAVKKLENYKNGKYLKVYENLLKLFSENKKSIIKRTQKFEISNEIGEKISLYDLNLGVDGQENKDIIDNVNKLIMDLNLSSILRTGPLTELIEELIKLGYYEEAVDLEKVLYRAYNNGKIGRREDYPLDSEKWSEYRDKRILQYGVEESALFTDKNGIFIINGKDKYTDIRENEKKRMDIANVQTLLDWINYKELYAVDEETKNKVLNALAQCGITDLENTNIYDAFNTLNNNGYTNEARNLLGMYYISVQPSGGLNAISMVLGEEEIFSNFTPNGKNNLIELYKNEDEYIKNIKDKKLYDFTAKLSKSDAELINKIFDLTGMNQNNSIDELVNKLKELQVNGDITVDELIQFLAILERTTIPNEQDRIESFDKLEEYIIKLDENQINLYSQCGYDKLYSVAKYYASEYSDLFDFIRENIENYEQKDIYQIFEELKSSGHYDKANSLKELMAKSEIYEKIQNLPYDSIGIYKAQTGGREYVLYDQMKNGEEIYDLQGFYGIAGICGPSSVTTIISGFEDIDKTQEDIVKEMKTLLDSSVQKYPKYTSSLGAGTPGNIFLELCDRGYHVEGYGLDNCSNEIRNTFINKIKDHLESGYPVWVGTRGYFAVTDDNGIVQERNLSQHAISLIDIRNNNGNYEAYVSDSSGAEGWININTLVYNNATDIMFVDKSSKPSELYINLYRDSDNINNYFINENGYMMRPKVVVSGSPAIDNAEISDVYVDSNYNVYDI